MVCCCCYFHCPLCHEELLLLLLPPLLLLLPQCSLFLLNACNKPVPLLQNCLFQNPAYRRIYVVEQPPQLLLTLGSSSGRRHSHCQEIVNRVVAFLSAQDQVHEQQRARHHLPKLARIRKAALLL
jgi:hypothetical protein